MKKFLLTVCLVFGIVTFFPAIAGSPEVIPVIEKNIPPTAPTSSITTLKIKQMENLLGRKLSFKEKLALKIYKWKEKFHAKPEEGVKSKKGKTSMILGIVALGVLIVPYLAIATIPLGILAIVFGNQAKKENPNDGQAKAGVILGWVALGLVVVAVIVALAFISLYTL